MYMHTVHHCPGFHVELSVGFILEVLHLNSNLVTRYLHNALYLSTWGKLHLYRGDIFSSPRKWNSGCHGAQYSAKTQPFCHL